LSDPNILFVVTHPDDESLWCSSIIKTLKDWGCRVSAICLTGGDDKVRRAEYARACVVLGIPVCMMTLPDKTTFPDLGAMMESTLDENGINIADIDLVISHSFYGEEQNHFQHKECFFQVKRWCDRSGKLHGFFAERCLIKPMLNKVNSEIVQFYTWSLLSKLAGFYRNLLMQDVRIRTTLKYNLHLLLYLTRYSKYNVCVSFPVDLRWKHSLLACYRSRSDVQSDQSYKAYMNRQEFLYLPGLKPSFFMGKL